jgi:hypothetical protein
MFFLHSLSSSKLICSFHGHSISWLMKDSCGSAQCCVCVWSANLACSILAYIRSRRKITLSKAPSCGNSGLSQQTLKDKCICEHDVQIEKLGWHINCIRSFLPMAIPSALGATPTTAMLTRHKTMPRGSLHQRTFMFEVE